MNRRLNIFFIVFIMALGTSIFAHSYLDYQNLSVSGNSILYQNGRLGMGKSTMTSDFHVGVTTRYNNAVYGKEIRSSANTTALTIDWRKGGYQHITVAPLSGDLTITFIPPLTSAMLNLLIDYGGTFTHNIIWPSGYKGQFGTGPLLLSKKASSVDMISFYYTKISGVDLYYAFPAYDFR